MLTLKLHSKFYQEFQSQAHVNIHGSNTADKLTKNDRTQQPANPQIFEAANKQRCCQQYEQYMRLESTDKTWKSLVFKGSAAIYPDQTTLQSCGALQQY